jgi:hypothetical protein
MNTMNMSNDQNAQDPLGLSGLPLLSPEADGWPAIRAALETGQQRRRNWRWAGGLAAAASVFLALGLSFRATDGLLPDEQATTVAQQGPAGMPSTDSQPTGTAIAQTGADTLPDLIAMSQLLETHVRGLRDNTSGLPARSALYTAELEDLIARVDGEISIDPESVNLWAQRVNLLLDLQYIYQHQFDREFGRMASL